MRKLLLVSAGITALALSACDSDPSGPGGTTLPPGLTLRVDPFISSGLSNPVFLTQPLNDDRIFVVEKGGRIRVIRDGVLQPTPFLDISSRVSTNSERGLLSVAFHPDYATNHFFYTYSTELNGDIRIERFRTDANPEFADPGTTQLILNIPHNQQANHNGGLLTFGPDGMLYAAVGDGGGAGDPFQSGQDPNTLLASMLRLDVNKGISYTIPEGNPYIGQAGKRPEIWAKGLRNPWRYAFDGPTGLLYIADVGQGAREEINVVPWTLAGANYGWSIMEGNSCYNATSCSQTGLTLPVLDYTHTNGACSITGGYVYRGTAIEGLQGHYLYSDYCAGFLRSFRYDNGQAVDQKDWGITMSSVTSFGRDFAGELYITSGNSILKISQGT